MKAKLCTYLTCINPSFFTCFGGFKLVFTWLFSSNCQATFDLLARMELAFQYKIGHTT